MSSTPLDFRRGLWSLVGPPILALILCAPLRASAAPAEVAGPVAWTDATGSSGSGVFQGTTDGASLSGSLYAGPDRLLIQGTVAPDGSVSGTAGPPGGPTVASFTGTRQGGYFFGTYTAVGGGPTGTWSAPADQFPTGSSVQSLPPTAP